MRLFQRSTPSWIRVVSPVTGYTTPHPVWQRWSIWVWVFVVLGIGVMIVSANYVVRSVLDKTHIASPSVFAVTPTASPVTQVTIVRETQIVERIVVVTATPEPQVATQQLPLPRQPQPAAWPAPVQVIPTPTARPTLDPGGEGRYHCYQDPNGLRGVTPLRVDVGFDMFYDVQVRGIPGQQIITYTHRLDGSMRTWRLCQRVE